MQELKPTGEPVTLPINSLKPGLHHKIFSSYKPVLLLHDLAILLLSFSLMLFAAGPGLQHQKSAFLVLMAVMSHICLHFYIFGIQSLQLRCEFYLESSFCANEKGFGLGFD